MVTIMMNNYKKLEYEANLPPDCECTQSGYKQLKHLAKLLLELGIADNTFLAALFVTE